MTEKEIEIIEYYFHEVFEKRQEADERGNVRDYDFYDGQMEAINEIENRLGIDVAKFWNSDKCHID